MLSIAIKSLCLMGLLKAMADEEIGFWKGVALAFAASLGSAFLLQGLAPSLGLWAIPVALGLVGLGLGAAISAICGTEIKRSFLVAAAYILVDLVITMIFLGVGLLFA
jgi:hypothetical protein